jgi:hypothetical protein
MENEIEKNIQQLNKQKAQLIEQIADIENKKTKQKVLTAISEQKYFYLKEYPHVIFDRDTSFLWPEKELDISKIETELTGGNLADSDEVKSLLCELSQIDYLKIKGWEIPAPFDFQSIIDKNSSTEPDILPSLAYKNADIHYVFRTGHEQQTIVNKSGRLLVLMICYHASYQTTEVQHLKENTNGSRRIINQIIYQEKLDESWAIESQTSETVESKQFFLVNKKFAINKYSLDPSFDKLSEKEQETTSNRLCEQKREDFLSVLLKNSFMPIFNNPKVIPLYDILLKDLPELETQLEVINRELEKCTAIISQQRELLSSEFNYRQLLSFNHFDCLEIDGSPIRFSNETIRWCGLLQEKAAEYQIRQYKLITEGNELIRSLAKKYKQDGNLSKTENSILESRRAFLYERLNMDMNIPIANLASMKLQCFDLKKKLSKLNTDDNGLVKLGEYAAEPRASFDLVAENSATMLIDVLKRIEFHEKNKSLVSALIHADSEWHKDFKGVKSVSKEKLKAECEEDDIDEKLWLTWFSEWSDKRLLIENCLQPLLEKGVEGAFEEHNLETKEPLVTELIELLTAYKIKVDEFYLSDRKSIHYKFAFKENGELQEKFEAESELYKHTISFQTKLHDIVFSLEKVEERLWLFHWGDALVDMAIDSVLDFIRDKELDSISKTIIGDFTQLRLQNYATFINDAKAHAEMSAKWDKEYNSLMFKMRKELNQTISKDN